MACVQQHGDTGAGRMLHLPAPYLREASKLVMTLQQLRMHTSLSRGLWGKQG